MHSEPINYLKPDLPAGLRVLTMPVVDASPENLQGYGLLVDDPEQCKVEIVRWPVAGWRLVDADSGDEAGTTQGVFVSEWQGDSLRSTSKKSKCSRATPAGAGSAMAPKTSRFNTQKSVSKRAKAIHNVPCKDICVQKNASFSMEWNPALVI